MINNVFERTRPVLFLLILALLVPLYIGAQQNAESKTNNQVGSNLVSLNLKDVNIEDALKIIAAASGYNIVLDKDVKATVSIILKGVSWQTALENILKTNELTYRIQDNIIRVMTLTSIKKEEDLFPLATKIITLNFARADVLMGSLRNMLSSRGKIEVNIPTNSLIVTDSPEALVKVEEIAHRLDMRTPQVIIESLIVSVKLSDSDKLGIDWTMTHKAISGRRIQQTLKPSSSTLDLYYGKTILPNWNFTAQLAAYAEDEKVHILASPRILTLDNLPAQIEITEQVPYTYTSSSTQGGTVTSTQFKDVGVKLFVTPHITKDKFISLSVRAEQSYVGGYVGVTSEPSIDSRKAETNLMLRDGETVVIGGLRKKDKTTTIEKVPLLGDIPLLGKLFQKQTKDIVDTELIIFITPHIVKEQALLSTAEKEKLEKSREELFGPTEKEQEPLEIPPEQLSDYIEKEQQPLEAAVELPVTAEENLAAQKPEEGLAVVPTEKEKAVLRDVVIAEALIEALDKISKPSAK